MDVSSYNTVFFTVLPLVVISFLGAWFRSRRWYDASANASVSWLLVHFFTPCLILDAIMANPHVETVGMLFEALFVGFCAVSIGVAISWWIASRYIDTAARPVFAVATGVFNYGYLPIPLVMIFSTSNVLATLLLFNIGVEIAIWTVGLYVIQSGHEKHAFSWKKILSPPLVAVLSGVLFHNQLASVYGVPGVQKTIHMTGQATIPVAFLFLGALVYEYIPSLKAFRIRKKEMLLSVVARMALIPCVFFLGSVLFPVSQDLKMVLAIQAAMPSAVAPIVLAHRIQRDVDLAVSIVIATTAVSLFSIPLWFSCIA